MDDWSLVYDYPMQFSTIHLDSRLPCGRKLRQMAALHITLHTWYVGARTAPATSGGFTEPREPPTCRRLPRDFALFPGGYRDSFRLTVVSHPKARSRPASA